MKLEHDPLENRFFYRLVKTLYTLSVALLVLATIFYMNDYAYQTLAQDDKNSYVECQNGKKYTLDIVGIKTYISDPEISEDEQNIADTFCRSQAGYINQLEKNKITVKYKRDLYGSRYDFMIMLFISFICYMMLNIAKETLIYLAFGRKFTWKQIIGYRHIDSQKIKYGD